MNTFTVELKQYNETNNEYDYQILYSGQTIKAVISSIIIAANRTEQVTYALITIKKWQRGICIKEVRLSTLRARLLLSKKSLKKWVLSQLM